MKDEREDFADQLGRYLGRTGFTQQELANKTRVHRNTIVKWMNRTLRPRSRGPVIRLVDALSLTAEEAKALFQAARISKEEWPATIRTIPVSSNNFFTGRNDILHSLHQLLIPGRARAVTQAISGPGGIGKTQTAAEYAYRYRQYYDTVLWLQAASWEDLALSCFQLANQLGLPEQQEMDEVVAKVQDWLRKHRDWLLILENVENPQEVLPKIVPTDHRGSVLVSTRIHDIELLAQTQELAPMSEEEAILFLLRRTKTIAANAGLEHIGNEQYHEARQICLLMDGLPLALDQAGAYILETGCSLARYLDLYRQSHKQCLARRGKYAIDHAASVYATFALIFRRIRRTNIVAAELLYLLAFLSPDDIPEDLITQAAPHLGYATRLALHFDPFALDTARSLLLSFSLLSRHPSEDAFHMHRLVQVVLKDWLVRRHLQYREFAVRVVNKVFPEKVEIQDWPTCRRYLPHALVCRDHVEQEWLVLFDAAELFQRAGLYCSIQALYRDAQRFFEQALRIVMEIFGQDSPRKAPLLHNLGVLAITDGRIDESQYFFEQALTLLEDYPHVPGFDDARHRVLHNIAMVYYEQGKEEEAEQLLQQLINERETWTLSEQPDRVVARMFKDMAYLRRNQGRYQEAERLLQRALYIQENAPASTDSADIANTLLELANLYQILHNEREAEPLYIRSIAISENIYGPNHPAIAPTLQSLVTLLLSSREEREGEAKQYFARAVHITEQTFGVKHPRTIEMYDEYYDCFGEEYPGR